MPALAFGSGATDSTRRTSSTAASNWATLSGGFRHLDCAEMYGTEAKVDFGSRLSSIELLRGRAPVMCTAELTSYGRKKIAVIKAIQGITRKDLKSTAKMGESTPSVVVANVPRARAIAAASALERVGAKARVKCQ